MTLIQTKTVDAEFL